MSKRAASDGVAEQIASFIGKSMGELMNKKESLQKQLVDVERQIAGVRRKVLKQFGAPEEVVRRGKTALRKAGKTVRRELSAETRRKMAIAARKRWARVRKAKEGAGD